MKNHHSEPTTASLREMPEIDFSKTKTTRPGARKDRPMTLAVLRAAVGVSQAAIAKRAGITQSEVSRAELRSDCLVSTLERYAKALGGELGIVVTIDGRSYPITLK